MNNMKVYEKNRVLKESFITRKVYVGLKNGGGEVTAGSYKRVLGTFTEPENGQIKNKADIEFPVAQESWGDIKEISIYDSLTGGNEVWSGTPEVVKNISEASQYKIPKGYMIVRLS